MRKPIEGLSQLLKEAEAQAKFDKIKLDGSNLIEVYTGNLKVWYYRNSDEREPVNDEFEIVNYQSKDPDKLICSKMHNGIRLTESDFVEEEIELLSVLKERLNDRYLNKARNIYLNYLNEIKVDDQSLKSVNPYPEIFTPKGFLLFDRLYNEYRDSGTLLADFSFIYRILVKSKEQFIHNHIKPEIFKDWLCKEPYSICLDHQLKTLDRCSNRNKLNSFQNAKDLINLQSN
jgi:hypothetical protein